MHVDDLERQLGARRASTSASRARRDVIVGNDDAHRRIGRHLERAERAQRQFQLAPAVGADADVDPGLAAWIFRQCRS